MTRAWLAAIAVCAGAASAAHAHELEARHQVTVQAEADQVAILITYMSSNGDDAISAVAGAAYLRNRRGAVDNLRSVATAKALSGIEVHLDGRPIVPTSVDSKLIIGPRVGGRIGAVVLMTAKIPPGAHDVTVVARRNQGPVSLSWTDRSRGRARSATAPNRWHNSHATLIVRFAPSAQDASP